MGYTRRKFLSFSVVFSGIVFTGGASWYLRKAGKQSIIINYFLNNKHLKSNAKFIGKLKPDINNHVKIDNDVFVQQSDLKNLNYTIIDNLIFDKNEIQRIGMLK